MSTKSSHRSNHKGQVALEYIITYGWGFLAILVIIAALTYFGLFSPSRYAPSRCDFGVQMECVDYKMQDTGSSGKVFVQFRNNFGDDVRIVSVYLFDDTSSSALTWPAGSTNVISKGNVSAIFTIVPNTPGLLVSGDRVTMPIVITFQRASGTAPLHNLTGEVFSTVTT